MKRYEPAIQYYAISDFPHAVMSEDPDGRYVLAAEAEAKIQEQWATNNRNAETHSSEIRAANARIEEAKALAQEILDEPDVGRIGRVFGKILAALGGNP